VDLVALVVVVLQHKMVMLEQVALVEEAAVETLVAPQVEMVVLVLSYLVFKPHHIQAPHLEVLM
tara:strand:- start:12 stop:203 length:192 start_codon:yes stop_codon:yes gene_type:complete